MNYESNNNKNAPDSPFIGFGIGVIICLIVSMFHTCATSCSRKVTDHLETTDSLRTTISTNTHIESQDSITTSLSNTVSRIVIDNTSWILQTVKTHYSAPDSLGNQYVTLIENSHADFGNQRKDSTSGKQNLLTTQHSQTATDHSDTITITQTKTLMRTITKESPTPWYYKCSLAVSIILLISIFLYIFYKRFHKRITQNIAYYLNYNDEPEE